MIVVSGVPRAGTSLQMLIVKNLGLSIAGEPNSRNRWDLNPTGMWEEPFLLKRGLQKPIKEDAIKLVQAGLEQTTVPYRLVYCIRDPREIVISHRTLPTDNTEEEVWNAYLFESAWAIDNLPLSTSHIVDYKDVIKHPVKEVRRLAKFLGVSSTKKAEQTPNKKYYRSKKYNIEKNMYADKYYQYFKSLK